MKLPSIFKKKQTSTENSLDYDEDDLKNIPKKRRKRALKLLKEYNNGLVLTVDNGINQKELMKTLRKK